MFRRCPYFTGEPPSWNDAPDWARWLTQDQDGEYYWQEIRGYCSEGIWDSDPEDDGFKLDLAGDSHMGNNHAELAIEKRPEGV